MWEIQNTVLILLGLGVESKELTFLQISMRGVVVLIATLIIVRLGQKRSLGKKTAFDAVLLVILASALARAINGSAAFFPTLGGCLVIVLFHRLLGLAACRWHWLGVLMKSHPDILVLNGELQRDAMRCNHIPIAISRKICVWKRLPKISGRCASPASNAVATSASSKRRKASANAGACAAHRT